MRFPVINVAAVVAIIGLGVALQTTAHADDANKMIAVGAKAPAVVGSSTNAGKIENFDLSKALSAGAIVLYFFPKAFTSG